MGALLRLVQARFGRRTPIPTVPLPLLVGIAALAQMATGSSKSFKVQTEWRTGEKEPAITAKPEGSVLIWLVHCVAMSRVQRAERKVPAG